MKKWMAVLCFGWMAVSTMGQFYGLPIADGAKSPAAGDTHLSAGAALGDDLNLYGGRIFFAPMKGLGLFADAGAIDPDGGDWGPAFQGGAKIALPIKDSKVDVAVRATAGYGSFEAGPMDMDLSGFSVGALASRNLDWISPYAFLGLSFRDADAEVRGEKSSDSETDLLAAAGLLLNLGSTFSLYGEIAHVDDLFMNVGARMAF